jgi:hypothetical protein
VSRRDSSGHRFVKPASALQGRRDEAAFRKIMLVLLLLSGKAIVVTG